MSGYQRRLAAALGWIDTAASPEPRQPAMPRDVQGRFVTTRWTLNGGYQTPPPPDRPTPEQAEREHSQLIAALAQAPRVIPNLERG